MSCLICRMFEVIERNEMRSNSCIVMYGVLEKCVKNGWEVFG